MADTTTTHYTLTKPEVGASNDSWGVKLNANFDALDAALYAVSLLATAALPTATFNATYTAGDILAKLLTVDGNGSGLDADLFDGAESALFARLASPIFTGTPVAPTATLGTDTTQIATTAFVRAEVAALVGAAPGTIDTLAEIATALGNDPNFATSMTALIGTKLNSSAYTAADVLAKLLTVDGSGSGLDADFFDGQSANYYTAYSTTEAQAAATARLPAGVIVMWSGSVASIPAGWTICDGTNGTPDLRNRFIIGAGSTYAVAATGGTKDAVVVSHTHTATVTDPQHSHQLPGGTSSGGTIQSQLGVNSTASNGTSAAASTGITVGLSTDGVSGVNQNLPPYYALAYIMKT